MAREYSDAEQIQLCLRAQRGDRRAADNLIEATMPWVSKYGDRIDFKRILSRDERLQVGRVGVWKAILGFKTDGGANFLSYATWWIRAMIQNEIARYASPMSVQRTLALAALGMGAPHHKTRDNEAMLEAAYQAVNGPRLNVNNKHKGNRTDGSEDEFGDRLMALADSSVEESIEDWDLRNAAGEQLRKWVSMLREQERYVAERRLLMDPAMTLKQIGDELHVSRERIRQIEMKAIERIRRFARHYDHSEDLAA